MTTFGDAVYQFGGSPVGTSLTTSKLFSTASKGRAWFVDPTHGTNGTGRSPKQAFTTMDAAFDVVASGDIIYFVGNVAEQLTTPAQIFDVTIVGCGNQPRHADSTPSGGDWAAATWKAPSSPASSTPLLKVQQQGWKLVNILFDGPSDAAAVQIFRDGGSGDDERDGSHVHIMGCKFVAAQNHIEFSGGPSQVVIEQNLFFGSTGTSITNTVGAGIGSDIYYRILYNHFHDNDAHIDAPLVSSTVYGNTFGEWTTKSVDLTGGSNNMVWGNYLSGDYSTASNHYVAGTSDEWAGNFSADTAEAEVGDNAITTASPAS